MPVEQVESSDPRLTHQALRLVMCVATVIVAGTQFVIATLEWKFRTSPDGSNGAAIQHVIAATLLLAGLFALRLSHVRLRKIAIVALGIGALYYVGPGTLYFESLGINYTPAATDFPTVVVFSLYLLTPLAMFALAFVLFKGLPVRPQPPCTESSFVHRYLVDLKQEWKPVSKPSTGEPVKMPAQLGLKLAALIVLGTGIAFAISFPLNRKAGSRHVGWYDPYTHPEELHYSIFHPAVMFIAMFVLIAALWRVAAQRKMGRVLLGLAIGMQALIGVGLFV